MAPFNRVHAASGARDGRGNGDHLRRSTERFRAAGLPLEDARVAASRSFGNLAAIKEDARDARGGRGIESVVAGVRYGARCLFRTPFTTLTMAVVYALGIGFNATLFLFISSLVNSPRPGMTRDDSLVRIRGIERRTGTNIGREFSYPEYRDYAAQTSLFTDVAAWHPPTPSLQYAAAMDQLRNRSTAAPRRTSPRTISQCWADACRERLSSLRRGPERDRTG